MVSRVSTTRCAKRVQPEILQGTTRKLYMSTMTKTKTKVRKLALVLFVDYFCRLYSGI